MVFVRVDRRAQVWAPTIVPVLLVDLHKVKTGKILVVLLLRLCLAVVTALEVGIESPPSGRAEASALGVRLLRKVEIIVRCLGLS